jgi:hypothetical protein
LQPAIENPPSGLGTRLTLAVSDHDGFLDWPVDDNNLLLVRDVTSTNHIIGTCGQYLGEGDENGVCCSRCDAGKGCFASCRICIFVDAGHSPMVLAKGSCLCCLFSGRAVDCSFRHDPPSWVIALLHRLAPSFSFDLPASEPLVESTPVTPVRRSARSSKRPAPSSPSPPDRRSRGRAIPAVVEEAALAPASPAYQSPLTDALFAASLPELAVVEDDLVARIARARAELAEMEKDRALLHEVRDQRAKDSLPPVLRTRSGVWDHVARPE